MDEVGIGHVASLAIRRADDSVRLLQVVGHHVQHSSLRHEPPDSIRQLRGPLEALDESVIRVGEEDGARGGVAADVVEGVELAAEEVVDDGRC